MFARSVIRASTRSGLRALPMKAARASFITSTKVNADPLVPQTSIPTSSYSGGEVQRSTVDVGSNHEITEVKEAVTPLSQQVYNAMTPSMKKMTLMGKVVIITGGARGLGNHMARACIEAGAKAIAIFDANQTLGDQAAAELHELTGNKIPIEFFKVDVRDGLAIDDSVRAVVEKFGAPDVLINSAGIAE